MSAAPELALVPALQAPNNLEAEQALLGAILYNNTTYHRVNEVLRPEHFFEPVHQRVYEAIDRLLSEGKAATGVTLAPLFMQDPGLADMGGIGYIARLLRSGAPLLKTPPYA